MTERLLEERDGGTYYVGPLAPAQAYLRDCYHTIRVRHFDSGAVQVGEYLLDDAEPHSWGTSATGDLEEAWRYFAGVDFGPIDEEYDEEHLRSVLARYEP